MILSNRIALERIPAWIQHTDPTGTAGDTSPSLDVVGLRLAFDATSTDVVIAILNEIRRLKGPRSPLFGSPSAPLYLDGLSYAEVYSESGESKSASNRRNNQHLFLVNSQLSKRSGSFSSSCEARNH